MHAAGPCSCNITAARPCRGRGACALPFSANAPGSPGRTAYHYLTTTSAKAKEFELTARCRCILPPTIVSTQTARARGVWDTLTRPDPIWLGARWSTTCPSKPLTSGLRACGRGPLSGNWSHATGPQLSFYSTRPKPSLSCTDAAHLAGPMAPLAPSYCPWRPGHSCRCPWRHGTLAHPRPPEP